MSTHKNIDKICCIAMALCLVLVVAFANGEALGIQAADRYLGYEDQLFDDSVVHTIDIQMDDWEGFLSTCANEEYSLCDLVVDGESYTGAAIRAKGNTSLSSVAQYGNDRYSFKIEFDHYNDALTYHGLDKLSLNNLIQDNTMMKDYVSYQLMDAFGVDSPLCSYVYLTVNGEDWGLYLAVEGVEESFLQRQYGNDYGELYKPDSLSMGGGRGNGQEFDFSEWQEQQEGEGAEGSPSQGETPQEDGGEQPAEEGGGSSGGFDFSQMPGGDFDMGDLPEDFDFSQIPGGSSGEEDGGGQSGGFGQMPEGGFGDMPEGFDSGQIPEEGFDLEGLPEMGEGGFSLGGFSFGGDDVSLVYTDDNYDSYSNIFDNAKTDITDSDKDRLIQSIKQLNDQENLEEVVDIDEVIRYFVVHNFVCNSDSYTGVMVHNYYLYEEDGQLSMIPWDYNLAFGGFESSQDATSLVNSPIDTPVSMGSVESRPMLSWIFSDESYTQTYHQYFSEFIETVFTSGAFAEWIAETQALIAPYVEKDPTKFCTTEEFEAGVDALVEFCTLRAESIQGQLEGSIPATQEGQQAEDAALIDASGLDLAAMGSMDMGGMGGDGFGPGNGTMPEGMPEGLPEETPGTE